MDDARRFRTLDERHCQELLATHHVGRIAWQAADGPLVLPITYVCADDSIVFRTSPHGVISELIRPTDVALQIDALDEWQRSGWSVLVQGRAEAVAEPSALVHLWTVDGMVPWASGVRNLFIRITPRRVTGRIVVSRAETARPDRWST
jgi:nitroimidazol reductase NimA-like FMN-containing flavoprotein (pyridoxamine 5'-phosphate oxidase superfamily)